MARKSFSAQCIANAFPLWADIRSHEQSLGRQFLNPIGNTLDDILEQLQEMQDNQYLSSAKVSDIGTYYFVRLDQDFEFEKLDNDSTEWTYTPPSVSGVINSIYYPVTIAADNDIKSFWYDAVPTRISLNTTASGGVLLASGFLGYSPVPLIVLSGVLDVPNRVYVTVSGAHTYLNVDETSNQITTTTVQLTGTTRPGADITEELYFVHGERLVSQHDFAEISSIKAYGTVYNTTATIQVHAAAFNLPDLPTAYQGLACNEYKEQRFLFWDLGTGELTGQKTLNLRHYDAESLLVRLGGYTAKSDLVRYQLLDSNSSYLDARDLAIEPHSNRIWIVDSGVLYLFDGDLEHPDMTHMENRDYDAPTVIEADKYWLIPGETVTLFYVWKRPISNVQKYRIWVRKPDGTRKSLVSGVEVPYVTGASSWQAAPIVLLRNLQRYDEYTLTEVGDYTYCLEAVYADESSSVDKKVISVLSKTPEASFSIAGTTGDFTPITGVDVDSEYKIWVRNTDGIKYQLDIHFDNMLVDFKRKVFYFREPYDQVRIFDYT